MIKLTIVCILFIAVTTSANRELNLWNAAANGSLGYVQHAISTGANLNYQYQDFYGRTLLHVAAENNQQEIVNRLLSAGANVNQLDNFGNTPIYLASAAGLANMILLLYNHEGDVDIQNTVTGWSPLMAATANGFRRTVEALIYNAHTSMNLQDNQGYTALHHATEKNKREIVLLLLKEGADKRLRDDRGRTSAELARETHLEDLANIIDSYNNAYTTTTTTTTTTTKMYITTTPKVNKTTPGTTLQPITASLTENTANTYTFIILGATIAVLLVVLITTGVVLGIKKRKNKDQREFTASLW